MSTLKADTIVASDGSSPATLTKQSAAKAFHGYGDQAAGSLNGDSKTLNISSYLDTATGRSRLNITSAFDVSNGQMINGSSQIYDYKHYMVSTSQYECGSVSYTGTYTDGVTHAVVHGDLA
tara:strand:+ start:262 stop:624 length:363 start_codon:yes stop_codon:yes gene_type:complete